MARDRGYAIIRVLSTTFSDEVLAMLPAACKDLQFAASIQHTGDVDATVASIRALGGGPHNGLFEIIGLTCGCESGVELADAVSARYGKPFKTNGEELMHHRRDKYLMGEKVRDAGLRAAKQVETDTWEELKAFAEDIFGKEEDGGMENIQLVVKPLRSAGTENVAFVSSLEEAKIAFNVILGDQNLFGETNDKVLVQEFLSGKEYVVDCVSKDGMHKCVAIWVYDKAPCNGSKFVYFGVNLFESEDGVIEERVTDYVFKVLDALDIKEGPSHAEVMWLDSEDQPCLVEVGARPHGGEGTFTELSTPCISYNQLSVTLDALENNGKFELLPTRPKKLKAHSREVTLVSREEGLLIAYPMLEEVRALQSYKSMEIKVLPGQDISLTVDFLSTPGSIMLVHPDLEVVVKDYDQIHRWEEEGRFYELAEEEEEKEAGGMEIEWAKETKV